MTENNSPEERLIEERLTCNVSPSIFNHVQNIQDRTNIRKKMKLHHLPGLFQNQKRLSTKEKKSKKTDKDYDSVICDEGETITPKATDNSVKPNPDIGNLNIKIDAQHNKPIKKQKKSAPHIESPHIEGDNLDSSDLTTSKKKRKTNFMNELDLVKNEIPELTEIDNCSLEKKKKKRKTNEEHLQQENAEHSESGDIISESKSKKKQKKQKSCTVNQKFLMGETEECQDLNEATIPVEKSKKHKTNQEEKSKKRKKNQEDNVDDSRPSEPSVKRKQKKKQEGDGRKPDPKIGVKSDDSDVVTPRKHKKNPRRIFDDEELQDGIPPTPENPVIDSDVSTIILESEARLWKTPTASTSKGCITSNDLMRSKLRYQTMKDSNRCSEDDEAQSLQCEFCSKRFSNSTTLKLHTITIHCEERPFKCNFCGKSFVFEKSLRDHLTMHCDKKGMHDDDLLTSTDVKVHPSDHPTEEHPTEQQPTQPDDEDDDHGQRSTEHQDSELKSAKLLSPKQQSSKQQSSKKQAVKRQSAKTPSVKQQSPKVRSTKKLPVKREAAELDSSQLDCSQMNLSARHHTHQKCVCSICNKTFCHKGSLTNHMATHEEKKFECETCHKKFALKHHLKDHSIIHEELRSYTCKICDVEYVTEKSYKLHEESHTVPKFACNECDETFFLSSHLKAHVKEHEGKQSLKCEECGLQFLSKRALTAHKVKHVEKKYECDQCHKKFCFPAYLNTHKAVFHSGRVTPKRKCEVCGAEYSSKQSLLTHMTTHGERNFQCDKCDKTFFNAVQLKSHAYVHSEERPFVCRSCNGKFKRKRGLKLHQLRSCNYLKKLEKMKSRLLSTLDCPDEDDDIDKRSHKSENDSICEIISDDEEVTVMTNDDEVTGSDDVEMTTTDDGEFDEEMKEKEDDSDDKKKRKVQCYKCTSCNRLYRKGDKLLCHLCILQKKKASLFFPFNTKTLNSSSIPLEHIFTPYKDNFESQQKMLRKT